jgi:ferredoxin
MMRIRIIEGRCQGHARCAALVPEMFDLDADGYSFVLPGHEEIADGDERALEQARLAVDNCPEEAIRVEPDV